MQRAMIPCNGVQTLVLTEGRWVEEGLAPDGNNHVVLVIPGNPGVPQFYEKFIKTLNERIPTETPVWLVAHAGHIQPPKDLAISMPRYSASDKHYSLAAQVDHKREFIKKYVPKDAKLHIVGHSIGSWVTLKLLQDEDISKRVEKCYMLFPTIEYMSDTPNGRFFCNVVSRIAPLLIFLSWIFTFFPHLLQEFLIRAFGLFYGIPGRHTKAVVQLLNPYVLKRVFTMASEEMRDVKERHNDIISTHANKLWFYYGATDGWAPVKYHENMTTKHPNVQAELCKRGFYHSFVLQHDEQMGKLVGDLINENIASA